MAGRPKRVRLPLEAESSVEPKKKKTKKERACINNLDDLLNLCWACEENAQFDSKRLWKLIPSLTELKKMTGMQKIKESIVDMVLYYVQDLHITESKSEKSEDYLHTVLIGPPGSGKTQVSHIIAKIYNNLGFLSTDKVIVAKRSDFIGKYIGHSEDKAVKIFNSALGGVLFIDEAYSMGDKDRPDSFSKAVIDLLNQFLSEHRKDFVCIIAGYEKELNESFFSINPGLKRRFNWKFTIDRYTPKELQEIFVTIVKRSEWQIEPNAAQEVLDEIKNKYEHCKFRNSGGDMENLFTQCKLESSKRSFQMGKKRVITIEDVKKAIPKYLRIHYPKEDTPYLSMFT